MSLDRFKILVKSRLSCLHLESLECKNRLNIMSLEWSNISNPVSVQPEAFHFQYDKTFSSAHTFTSQHTGSRTPQTAALLPALPPSTAGWRVAGTHTSRPGTTSSPILLICYSHSICAKKSRNQPIQMNNGTINLTSHFKQQFFSGRNRLNRPLEWEKHHKSSLFNSLNSS